MKAYCNEPIPSMKTVEEISELLRNKEIELEQIAKGKSIKTKEEIKV